MTAARKSFTTVILNVTHKDAMARVLPNALPANTIGWTSMTFVFINIKSLKISMLKFFDFSM